MTITARLANWVFWNIPLGRFAPYVLGASLGRMPHRKPTLDVPRLAREITALDAANMNSQEDGYSNMEWRSWPSEAIAAALTAEYARLTAKEDQP